MTGGTALGAGLVLLSVVGIAYGGRFLLRVTAGDVPANALQVASFRAGHAHAGVLVILGLVVGILLREAEAPEWSRRLGDAVLYAAILMPLGFFLSVLGRDPQRRNAWRWAILAGGISLVVGLLGAAAGLLVRGAATL